MLCCRKQIFISVFYEFELPRKVFRVVLGIRTQILVQRADSHHVFFAQFETHDFQILGKVVWLGTRDGNQIALNNPTKYDLRSSFIVFLGQFFQKREANNVNIALSERAPCLYLYAKFMVDGNVLFA